MSTIKPIRIIGKWRRDQGYVLDKHIVRSTFAGEDAFGNPRFDTERTELGELLYRLKYSSDKSALAPIVDIAVDFLTRWAPGCDFIVPVPPSKADRALQPVEEIAKLISRRMQWELATDAVRKVEATRELKDVCDYNERMDILVNAFDIDESSLSGRRVLLFDDLYRSGATLNAVADVLLTKGAVADLHVLALTRTRSR